MKSSTLRRANLSKEKLQVLEALAKYRRQIKDFDKETLINAASHDKKMSGDSITVVYVKTAGSFELKKISFSEYADMIRQVL